MASLLSYFPLVNRLVAARDRSINIPSVEVQDIEEATEKRPRTLRHLLRANHVNHSIIYHNLQFDNHTAHILCSAYSLGAEPAQLYHIYDEEAKGLEPWRPSPNEILQTDWRDFLGDKRYQRAYLDFFEDALVMRHSYDWKGVVEEYMLGGEEPLVNGLIGGLGHPLIHLGYAYEFDNREVAMEALTLASTQYNFLHKYTDDPSYTKPAPFSSTSPRSLLQRLSTDDRFDDIFKEPGFSNIEPLFQKHESLVLEYWNAWEIADPVKQFQESQEAAIDMLVATVPPGTHSYNFFIVHVLTTSHAVRILLPFLPPKFHISLVRQWWLLALAVYIAELRPKIDPDYIPSNKGKGWKYVQHEVLTNNWSTDAHFVKAIRAMKVASETWGDVHERYLAAAVRTSRWPTKFAMAPPAKRRKRAIVDDSDEEEDDDQQKPKNTLKRFLFSSPDSKPPATMPLNSSLSIESPSTPSPVRKRTTRAAAARTTAQSLVSPLSNRFAKRPTKSPSTSPDKSRGKAQKKQKLEEKGKTADLVTLFSRQAQRSQSQSQAGTASNGTGGKDSAVFDDIISDPISEDDDLALHKTAVASSIVGKAAQKRFKEASQSGLTSATSLNPAGGQRFLKQRGSTGSVVTDDDARPWSERFAPVNLEELAVHKKKVADVRKWLEDVFAGRMRQRLLILKGAAGTGKTTTVQLLAKDLRCDVLEWRNPNNTFGTIQGYQSMGAQFEEFLGRGGKFGQLDIESDTPPPTAGNCTLAPTSDKRLILIEEFPNTFMRSSTGLQSFRSTILQFLAANTPSLVSFGQNPDSEPITPIVMIISETLLTTASASADSFTAHRLLGPEILRHPGTGIIEFNSVAPSLLAKALELVVLKEARKSGRRRTPGPLVLKRLGEIGDIRSAISSLEFLCVKGDETADWGAKVAFTKPKRGSKDLISQREATLGIFHAVGKVVYNKRAEQPPPAGSAEAAAEMLPPHMAHLARPKRSEVNVDTLIDETGTDTHTFISALHENFPLSCEPSSATDPHSAVDYLDGCLDYLSSSDLNKGYPGGGWAGKDSASHLMRQDEMAFQVAVRGILFSLPSPVKRQTHPGGRSGDAFKMYYPAYLKLWRPKEELESFVDMWATKMLKGEDGPGLSSGFVSGPAVFRKGSSGTGSVESWGSRPANQAARPEKANGTNSEPRPLLSLGSAATQEMLLERLPYMAHIARRRRCTFGSMRIKDLDRIVSFHGIGAGATGESDDEGDEERLPVGEGELWSTDKPVEETPRKKRSRAAGLGAILSRGRAKSGQEEDGLETGGLPMQSLVLSDDDIEDD
ncbi:cell cycle checkpoint protein RAD17 [Echria macrotheca]|uniref:Cell cycle checkpoint protein RAD17 n=1 Tax=Echria macrotheca TaxID=438768 RepID=A0AAJ0BJY3_9PEZI|nr:cell cycle checkpoint protein RAD17 [Echria macrotheca]